RYNGFASFLAENGIAVVGEDHLGHGKSVAEGAPRIYFAENNGWNKVVSDIHSLREICGEKFSTTYFNDQYEKLALLKRCELSLKTVPLAIWNLDKYVEQGVKLPYSELGINKLEDVKSFLSVDKIGKYKVITVCHLFKQNKKLYALNTSLVSVNNNLYAVSTYDVNDKVFAPKDDAKLEDVPPIIKRMQEKEEAKVVNVVPADLDAEAKTAIWDEHSKFVKKFKPSKIK
ncbi:MAG: alpha/beta hydrolase, partial [Phascolarctobacterium sp.]|nr:alpha/beta hydrolase [Phascolarctobacterium sp.]